MPKFFDNTTTKQNDSNKVGKSENRHERGETSIVKPSKKQKTSLLKTPYPDSVVFFGILMNTNISLKPEFKLERKAMRLLELYQLHNEYIGAARQEDYLVELTSPFAFKNRKDELLDGEYNFVLTCEKVPKLLCDQTLHHSYLANGKKVLATGTLEFKEGTLVGITNNSGHYRPLNTDIFPIIKALYIASGKTLIKYTSFCTEKPLVYPVDELIKAQDFSSVQPLQFNEIIDIHYGQRITLSGYDQLPNQEIINPPRRFGKTLNKELVNKYKKILSLFDSSINKTEFLNLEERQLLLANIK
ncbi:Uncharacterised protein [Legionella busanensis]|uniref:Uncharacterized protein n=1 Tax=Legionella busanensis TaxID=190655 RepID=A0A378JM08_9GAMM|nr:hypothetical protein [Legionella busanensis]STX52117.1 Uncharacterised protein [Legionella busanensis]